MATKRLNSNEMGRIRKGKELLDNNLYDEAREIFLEYAYSCGACAFWLGCIYEFGKGVEKNDVQAVHWYQVAVNLGETQACYNLAQAYWWGRPGVEQDKTKALMYYSKSAESGDANAQFQMGYALFKGEGIEKDVEKGLLWFEKAADQNHEIAQYNLGRYYLFNAPPDIIDRDAGFKYMESSAKSGYTDAEVTMGYLYSEGIGVEKNFETSKLWFEKAAYKGDKVALYNLGSLYYHGGDGIEIDYKKAFDLCLKSAQMGYTPAEERLSYLYANGEGVPKNRNEAKRWFDRAKKEKTII